MAQQLVGISRSISACKRCRKKKIKCSHDFPRCTACAKANAECISLDPATGREIPRSYIVHLENRVAELENLIKESHNEKQNSNLNIGIVNPNPNSTTSINQIDMKQQLPSIIPHNSNTTINTNFFANTPNSTASNSTGNQSISPILKPSNNKQFIPNQSKNKNDEPIIDSIHNYTPNNANDDSSRPTSFSGNGISFSKLMFAAVHFNDGLDEKEKEKGRRRSSLTNNTNNSNLLSSSSIKPPIDPTSSSMSSFSKNVALLPPKQQALNLLSLYFDQSNSQLPIFHREEFLKNYFIPIYGDIPKNCSFASSNNNNNNNTTNNNDDNNDNKSRTNNNNSTTINWKSLPKVEEQNTWYYQYTRLLDAETGVDPEMDPFKFSAKVVVPRRFKKSLYFINIVFAVASSVWHLQYPSEISENFKNAALLHIEDAYSSINRLEALQAMLCLTLYSLMRPCVPGVWYLSGSSLRLCIDLGLHNESNNSSSIEPFILDMRRRLFWCCYSLDRQICVYLGRPFGIPEESIKVQFPSILDDSKINNESTLSSLNPKKPQSINSYKHISITMFKIRQLQAEIQSILYDNKEIPRIFPSLSSWLVDMTIRLDNWKSGIQKIRNKMNCAFTIEFFDLNYYHAKMMLHGLTPARYILSINDFTKLAEASKGTLLTFYKLWNRGALNYTWAVTQNVFVAHMNFLYAIFHNDEVRSSTTVEEVKKLSDYAKIILKSLINRCNAAEQCLEVLAILSQAVLKLKYPAEYNQQKDFKYDHASNNKKVDLTLRNSNNKDNDDQNILSSTMKRLPSEDEVKTLQPGGHITGNMRRLIVSIPELINAEENKSTSSKSPELTGGDRKRIKLENSESPISHSIFSSNNTTPYIGSLALTSTKDFNIPNDTPENTWGLTESDMDRFFDEVRKVESPESTRSYSHLSACSAIDNPSSEVIQPKQVNIMNVTPSSSSIPGTSSSPSISIDSNKSANNNSSNSEDRPNILLQQQQQQQLYMQSQSYAKVNPLQSQYPSHQSQSPGNTSLSHLSYILTPTFPQQYTQYASPSTTTPFIQQFSNNDVTLNEKNDYKTDEPNTPNLSTSRKHSREGQRIFKLMYETGTESIWDQFFAQPFKLDEI